MKKARHIGFLIVMVLITVALSACGLQVVRGSGNVVEESREVSNISGVSLATIGDLTIEVGDSESFRIEAEDNLLEYLETSVRNGTLRIEGRDNVTLDTTKPIRYFLTVTDLDTIEISSVGNIEAPDLAAEAFSIKVSSTGDLSMGELNASSLDVEISSIGKVTIAGGEVGSQEIDISSTGSYSAEELASSRADVRLSSTGSATIWVSDHLVADLSSSGNLRYRGNPTVDAKTSSIGDVIPIGE